MRTERTDDSVEILARAQSPRITLAVGDYFQLPSEVLDSSGPFLLKLRQLSEHRLPCPNLLLQIAKSHSELAGQWIERSRIRLIGRINVGHVAIQLGNVRRDVADQQIFLSLAGSLGLLTLLENLGFGVEDILDMDSGLVIENGLWLRQIKGTRKGAAGRPTFSSYRKSSIS